MPASIGVNLRVTGNCRQGGRKYMEDFFSVAYQQTEDEKDLEYAFFGIFDGHGGAEAAAFAKEHLMETIIKHKNFWSENDEDVLRAIKEGYIATHYAMWREQAKWPRTSSGFPSTAGTTASVAFIRRGKIYIGHVGDSGIVLGYQDSSSPNWKAKPLTRDHKPENPEELKRIHNSGGKVVSKSGVPRVVWNRPRIGHQGPVRRSTPIDEIPFLAVARSLGDLWSYNSQINQFIVSPNPDCSVIPIDSNIHRCLIFGTDGLFNMLSPTLAVHIVQHAERHNECSALSDSVNKVWLNPSKLLVQRALEGWMTTTKMRADNTSVVTLMLDPPGPPRAQVLKDRKKNLPESGLKIMTRYDESGPQQFSTDVALTKDSQTTSTLAGSDIANSVVPNETEVNKDIRTDENKLTEDISEHCDKSNLEGLNSNNSISSSDVSSNFFHKEHNDKHLVTELRESFDPGEILKDSFESTSFEQDSNICVEDNTIQINEISSSNIDESNLDDEKNYVEIQRSKISLSVSNKECVVDRRKLAKRKSESEEILQRKSLRLSLNSKLFNKVISSPSRTKENAKKDSDDTCKSNEKKGKKVETVKTKTISARVKKLKIARTISKEKKLKPKRKSVIKNALSKKKIKLALETVLSKTTKNKEIVKQTIKKKSETKKKSLKAATKKPSEKENVKKKQRNTKKVDAHSKISKNKKVICGKISTLKKQTVKNSIRVKNGNSKSKALKHVIENNKNVSNKKILSDTIKNVKNAARGKAKKEVLKENRSKKNIKELKAESTRKAAGSSSGSPSPCLKSVHKEKYAKENITPKGKKAGSQPKQGKNEKIKKNTVRQRIQDKTKAFKKTVLRK